MAQRYFSQTRYQRTLGEALAACEAFILELHDSGYYQGCQFDPDSMKVLRTNLYTMYSQLLCY